MIKGIKQSYRHPGIFLVFVLLISLGCSLPVNFQVEQSSTQVPPVQDQISTNEVVTTPLLPEATMTPAGAIPIDDPLPGTWSVYASRILNNSEFSLEEAQTWLGNTAEITNSTISFNGDYCLLNDFQRLSFPEANPEQFNFDLSTYGINLENSDLITTNCVDSIFGQFVELDSNSLVSSWQGGVFWLKRLTPDPSDQLTVFSEIFRADNSPTWSVEVEIPQVPHQVANAADFNRISHDQTSAVFEQFILDSEDLGVEPGSVFAPSNMQITYQVHWNHSSRLSILQSVYFYVSGAAHPNSYFLTLNYDFANGKELSLSDIFNPDSDYLDFILTNVENELNARDIGYFDSLLGTPEDFANFTFSDQGLIFHFDPYQVAAYAAGPQSVLIPYEALNGYLLPDYLP